ncbi:MAG TPA: patatin-like phospholipase family protein [Legionellaceae bacterium]|nr:patatin-like phospholipase family protein [Legionellaceae bacterium]
MAKKILWIIVLLISLYIGLSYRFNAQYSQSIIIAPQPQNTVKTCHAFHPSINDKNTIRVLIVDGGGIDGIMPLVILNYLEKRTGKPIYELFDFFTGTSTGAIIVSALNIPNEIGQAKYTAEQILDLYRSVSQEVLNPPLIRKILTLNGFIAPHLSIKELHEGYKKYISSNILFGQLLKKVAITAFDINDKQMTIFNSWDCDHPITHYLAADVITAATATPTYFSPVIFTRYSKDKPATFIDGMIFANNPSLKAIHEAFKLYPNAKKFVFVHLGTGGNSLDFLHLSASKIQHWGILRWIFPMITILYKSQNLVIKDAIADIQNFSTTTRFEYHYFSKNLTLASPFDTSKENIETISKVSKELLTEQKTKLDEVALELLQN